MTTVCTVSALYGRESKGCVTFFVMIKYKSGPRGSCVNIERVGGRRTASHGLEGLTVKTNGTVEPLTAGNVDYDYKRRGKPLRRESLT